MPCTIIANNGTVVYGAQCFFNESDDELSSAVLVYRGDQMPAWAKSYIYNDPSRFAVIVPKSNIRGHYRGQVCDYRAERGEVVLYLYESDSFMSIGKIEREGGWDRQRAQIQAILDKLAAEVKQLK